MSGLRAGGATFRLITDRAKLRTRFKTWTHLPVGVFVATILPAQEPTTAVEKWKHFQLSVSNGSPGERSPKADPIKSAQHSLDLRRMRAKKPKTPPDKVLVKAPSFCDNS